MSTPLHSDRWSPTWAKRSIEGELHGLLLASSKMGINDLRRARRRAAAARDRLTEDSCGAAAIKALAA